MSLTFAQTNSNTPDQKLIDALGQETVNFYLNNDPNLIGYYNFFLNYSYKIVDMPEPKMDQLDQIPVMRLKEKFLSEPEDFSEIGLQKLNIMKYEIKIDPINGAMYRLGNTTKLIIFYSGKEITTMYNETIQKTK
jgi:hypothetical protein